MCYKAFYFNFFSYFLLPQPQGLFAWEFSAADFSVFWVFADALLEFLQDILITPKKIKTKLLTNNNKKYLRVKIAY